MPVETLSRGHLSTLSQFAEITKLQRPKEVDLAPNVGTNSHLEGTGFNLPLEMDRLTANYNQNLIEGKDHLEALMLSAAEAEANVRTYIIEYIQTKTILPHLNKFAELEGKVRMVGRNGVSVLAGITADERNGSVLDASVAVEDFLTGGGLEKTKNRLAVINSPLGHSGLISWEGKIIRYKSNQTMVFWTDGEGELHGLTIVSDLNKAQSRQLSIDLGTDEDLLDGNTEAEQVANIVANPVLFSYGKEISNPAEYVLEKIIAIRGNSDIKLEQEDGTVEKRSVVQTWKDLDKSESLLKFNPFWENCLTDLRKTILSKGSNLNNPSAQAEIARVIEETILEITVDYLQQIQSPKFSIPQDNVIYFKSPRINPKYGDAPVDKYAIAAAFLKTRSGCAGGGGSRTSLRGISSGSSVSNSSSIESGSGICEECKKPNLDNHYHCPDCNKEYADETNTERTPVCACGFEFGCGGSADKEEEQKEDSKIIAFPSKASAESLAPAELPKAA